MLKETSFIRANKIIESIAKVQENADDMSVIKIGCYLSQSILKQYAKKMGCSDFCIVSGIDGWRKFLPIPKQNYIVLFDLPLRDVLTLYNLVKNDFLIIEVLIIKNNSDRLKLKELILSSKTLLFYEIKNIKRVGGQVFFCGFDFDNPNFESGIAEAYCADFIPESLKIYL